MCMDVAKVDDQVYKEIYKIVLACGNEHTLRGFALKALTEFQKFCDFDEGLIYFLDTNLKIADHYLLHIDTNWNNLYLKVYDGTLPLEYSVSRGAWEKRELPNKSSITLNDWTQIPEDDFYRDCILPRKLKYTCSVVFYDMDGRARTVVCMDRTHEKPFESAVLQKLELILPQLNNLHKNFFARSNPLHVEALPLSPREMQIATMLCQGMSPANISKTLYIAVRTTRKHMEHINEKLGVSNIQELIVKMLTSGALS